jgi:hypothetical protein
MALADRNDRKMLDCLFFWSRLEPTLALLAAIHGFMWPEIVNWLVPVGAGFRWSIGIVVGLLSFVGSHYSPTVRPKFEIARRFPSRSCLHRLALFERLLEWRMRRSRRLPAEIDLGALR